MANIEGESLKRMAGSTSAGAVSAITGWLSGKGAAKGSSGGKSGLDYHNQELAKQFDFKREKSRNRSAVSTARKVKAEGLPLKETLSQTPDAGTARVSYYPPTSSGGQGTSGNKRGRQFGKPAPAPSLPGPGGRRVQNPAYVKWKAEQ